MGGFHINRARHAGVYGLQPRSGANAPRVARLEAGEIEVRRWRYEVVALVQSELKKIVGHHTTDGMRATVVVVRVATTVAIPSGEGHLGTRLQGRTKNIDAWVHVSE